MTMRPIPDEDLAIITQHGVPLELSPQFVAFRGKDVIRLTDRGRRLFRLACVFHGLSPAPVERVRSTEDLQVISIRIKQMRMLMHEQLVSSATPASGRDREERQPQTTREVTPQVSEDCRAESGAVESNVILLPDRT